MLTGISVKAEKLHLLLMVAQAAIKQGRIDQLYQAYAESHESDPTEISDGLRTWRNSCAISHWTTTTLSSTSAAVYVVLMNEKPLSMEYSTGHT